MALVRIPSDAVLSQLAASAVLATTHKIEALIDVPLVR
jgi:hypothetical protein